jgi:hypothetical protein
VPHIGHLPGIDEVAQDREAEVEAQTKHPNRKRKEPSKPTED